MMKCVSELAELATGMDASGRDQQQQRVQHTVGATHLDLKGSPFPPTPFFTSFSFSFCSLNEVRALGFLTTRSSEVDGRPGNGLAVEEVS